MKSQILRRVLLTAAVGVLAFLIVRFRTPEAPPSGWGILLAICVGVSLSLYGLWFAAVALHELGHIFGAKLSGMRIFSVGLLGDVVYCRPPFEKTWLLPGAAGYVLANKPKVKVREQVLFILFGPLFSLLGVLPALWVIPSLATRSATPGELAILLFSAFNLLLFASTVSVLRVKGIWTDMGQLVALARDPKNALRMVESLTTYNLALMEPVEVLRTKLATLDEKEVLPDIPIIFRTWIDMYDGHDDEAIYKRLKVELARAPYATHAISLPYVVSEIQYALSTIYAEDPKDCDLNYARAKQTLPPSRMNLCEAFRARREGRIADMNRLADESRKLIAESGLPLNEAYLRLLDRYIPPKV